MSSLTETIAKYLNPRPKEVEGLTNSSYLYYRSMLYNKIYSIFKWEYLPETWNIDYINSHLFMDGIMAVCKSPYGNVMLECGYEGVNLYNFPVKVNIHNHLFDGQFTIGSGAEIVYFMYQNGFMSLEPLVKRYALLLAQCDGSINVSLMNSRLAHVFLADDTKQYKEYQKIYDDISRGKPAVFLIKGMDQSYDFNNFVNVKNTYIANDIMLTKQQIMNEFLTEIGYPNANTSKRERLITDEVNANNAVTGSNIDLWVRTLNQCFEKVNKTFPAINVRVSKNMEVLQSELYQSDEIIQQ